MKRNPKAKKEKSDRSDDIKSKPLHREMYISN